MSTKIEANYNNSIIYKLECKKDPFFLYVGGTTNINNRKYQLKIKSENLDSKFGTLDLYSVIKEKGGMENFIITKIEDFPCHKEWELQNRTEYWIDKLDANKFMVSPYEITDNCKHDMKYSKCEECQDYKIKSTFCIHDRRIEQCRICRLFLICDHSITKKNCKKCVKNLALCKHDIIKHLCKDCNREYNLIGDMRICIHNLNKYKCNICKPPNICIHGNENGKCNKCNVVLCIHGKKASFCKICPDGKHICIHKKIKYYCRQCNENKIKIDDQECVNTENNNDIVKNELKKIISQLTNLMELLS